MDETARDLLTEEIPIDLLCELVEEIAIEKLAEEMETDLLCALVEETENDLLCDVFEQEHCRQPGNGLPTFMQSGLVALSWMKHPCPIFSHRLQTVAVHTSHVVTDDEEEEMLEVFLGSQRQHFPGQSSSPQ